MKILQIHNQYRAGSGGEDMVVEAERDLLLEHGHEVEQYLVSNSALTVDASPASLRAGFQSIWSAIHYQAIQHRIQKFGPDLVHVHNTFATLSPSVFWAVKRVSVPCVLTLHNYRLACATSTLFRDGHLCEECVGRLPLAAFRHRCRYNGSSLAGALIAVTQVIHRWLRTYAENVDAYIVLSPSFARTMQQAGLPANKLHVKHNCVVDQYQEPCGLRTRQAHIIYVGQIAQVKGVEFLLQAWSQRIADQSRLVIVGEGPDKTKLQARYQHRTDIVWQGRQDHQRVLELVAQSCFLVMPSQWREPFGLAAVEALMLGTPVILPDHIALADVLSSEKVGLYYQAEDLTSLAQALEAALQLTEPDWVAFSQNARRTYLKNFTRAASYEALIAIYNQAISASHL
jgi:glycosyltransferase involved in cell wall biosynthesis